MGAFDALEEGFQVLIRQAEEAALAGDSDQRKTLFQLADAGSAEASAAVGRLLDHPGA